MMTVVSAFALLVLIPAFTVLYQPLLAETRRESLRLNVSVASASATAWTALSLLVPGVTSSPLWLPSIAFAALGGFLVSIPLRGWPLARGRVVGFATVWCALVFAPVVTVVVFPTALGLDATGGVLDLGGALPVHVAVGASALAALLVLRGRPRTLNVRPTATELALAGGVLWASWALALVGLELAFDDVTPVILITVVLAPVASMLGWLTVERARRHTNSLTGAVAGVVCGLVAVSAGSGFLEPVWAIATGAIAGLVSAAVVIRTPASPHRAFVGAHLVPAAVGLVLLGLFSTGSGFIYTGQPTLAISQLTSTVAVALWSATVSGLLWYVGILLIRLARARQRVA